MNIHQTERDLADRNAVLRQIRYGISQTPYDFWRRAVEMGEVSQEQYEEAQAYYGELWHYTGD